MVDLDEQRQFAVAIIQSWLADQQKVDGGMGRQEAVDLFREAATSASGSLPAMTEADYAELPEESLPEDWQPEDPTKIRLQMLEAMTQPERKIFLLAEKVASEVQWHNELMVAFRQDKSIGMGEARKQRRVVQRWTKRLSAARKKLEENEPSDRPSQSSNHSEI